MQKYNRKLNWQLEMASLENTHKNKSERRNQSWYSWPWWAKIEIEWWISIRFSQCKSLTNTFQRPGHISFHAKLRHLFACGKKCTSTFLPEKSPNQMAQFTRTISSFDIIGSFRMHTNRINCLLCLTPTKMTYGYFTLPIDRNYRIRQILLLCSFVSTFAHYL